MFYECVNQTGELERRGFLLLKLGLNEDSQSRILPTVVFIPASCFFFTSAIRYSVSGSRDLLL